MSVKRAQHNLARLIFGNSLVCIHILATTAATSGGEKPSIGIYRSYANFLQENTEDHAARSKPHNCIENLSNSAPFSHQVPYMLTSIIVC
jgi:hypothetical protein